MERINQNLEFSQKLSGKSDECFERHPNNLYNLTRPPCASGGDMGDNPPANSHCNSKNTSYQDLSGELNEFFEQQQHFVDAADVNHEQLNVKRKSTNLHCEVSSKLKAELSKYKKELKEYNNTTKDLEEKYLMINYELSEMQQKHDRFVANRKTIINEEDDDTESSSSTGSEYSLKRKYTQVFHRGNSFLTLLQNSNSSNENIPRNLKHPPPNCVEGGGQDKKKRKHTHHHHHQQEFQEYHGCLRHNNINIQNNVAAQKQRHQSKRKTENKENETPIDLTSLQGRSPSAGLKDIYNVLKSVMENRDNKNHAPGIKDEFNLKELQTTIASLQNEQSQFRNIIQQQQTCLHDYHSRCIKAQQIMQTQQIEIEKLNSNNHQLETEITAGIDQLRVKIDNKLRDVSHLPQMMREEKSKGEKFAKENTALNERLRALQTESAELRLKLDELARRKGMTINRLKAAERDLKIFKNYNTALKHEKRKLCEELQKLKEQLDSVQCNSKRTLARQKEQTEKQRRDLQKRVFELELKLSRSQNSTTSLIQERDSLIAELQTQLNTLVHNFEVSQKHIRVLRRHIYSMSGGSVRSNNLIVNDTV